MVGDCDVAKITFPTLSASQLHKIIYTSLFRQANNRKKEKKRKLTANEQYHTKLD